MTYFQIFHETAKLSTSLYNDLQLRNIRVDKSSEVQTKGLVIFSKIKRNQQI